MAAVPVQDCAGSILLASSVHHHSHYCHLLSSQVPCGHRLSMLCAVWRARSGPGHAQVGHGLPAELPLWPNAVCGHVWVFGGQPPVPCPLIARADCTIQFDVDMPQSTWSQLVIDWQGRQLVAMQGVP